VAGGEVHWSLTTCNTLEWGPLIGLDGLPLGRGGVSGAGRGRRRRVKKQVQLLKIRADPGPGGSGGPNGQVKCRGGLRVNFKEVEAEVAFSALCDDCNGGPTWTRSRVTW